MVRVAYIDTVGGAAGDMILGAFLAAGLPLDDLRRAIELLRLPGVSLSSTRVERQGVRATKLTVTLSGRSHPPHSHGGRRDGPTLQDIEGRLTLSGLPESVIAASLRVFRCLAVATSVTMFLPIDAVRFDSSDIADTYVDIVGTAFALYRHDISRLYCSPLPLGHGVAVTPRGRLTLPDPLTLEIVRMTAAAARSDSECNEQVTPTGAAILTSLADFERPNLRVTARGAGAGTADLDVPNIVRLEIGDLETEPLD